MIFFCGGRGEEERRRGGEEGSPERTVFGRDCNRDLDVMDSIGAVPETSINS